MTTRVYHVVLVTLFCVFLCVPGLAMLVSRGAPELYGVGEVAMPKFKSFEQWPPAFEDYFAANLGLKKPMVQLNNIVGYSVVKDLQSDSVLVGKDGWLFLKQNYGWESMRSTKPLSSKEAKAWRRSLGDARDWLAEQKIPFLFVIVPAKESIYPEFLPASGQPARSKKRLDEILHLLRGMDIDYIELRTPLLEAKKLGPLYDKVDSHWNGLGARVGGQLVLRRMAELLGRPPSFAELDSHLAPRPSWADMGLILSLESYLSVPSVELLPNGTRARRVLPSPEILEPNRKQQTRMAWEVFDPTLPRALILRDSFAEGFMPTFSEKFSRTYWLWTHDLSLSTVIDEKPDIVVVEMTERFLSAGAPTFSIKEKERKRQRRH